MIKLKPISIKYFFLLLGFFFINLSNAQTYEFLKNKWLTDKSDTARVNAGLQLHEKYYYQSNDSLQSENKLLTGIYNLSVKIKYSLGIIESSFYLGNNYTSQILPQKAIEYYYISLKESEKIKNDVFTARTKMGIGIVYFIQSNWSKAINFFQGSLLINRKLKDQRRISTQHYLIGYSLIALKKFDDAKLYIDSALVIKLLRKDTTGINECRLALANIYKGQQNYDSAMKYYKTLLPYFLSHKEYVPVSIIHTSFAQILFKKNDYQHALAEAQKAYDYSLLTTAPQPKIEACEILYNIFKAQGAYKEAIYYFDSYHNLKDSIENSDFASQISLAQATYEFEKEQAAIKANQDRKELQYKLEIQDKNLKQSILSAITIIAILFMIAIVFAYRWVSRQKKITEDLLLNILPKETVAELKNFGKSLPKNHEEATIIFCDVKNFSHIAETLQPSEVVEMLDRYFKEFDIITEKYGVEKIKTIGDAYMCVGGLNKNTQNSANDTVKAAIEFLEFNEKIEDEMLEKYNQAFSFRIGIHTGTVVSGVVGLKKYAYDIWGDAVNIAARMEQNSVPGKINISGGTYHIIKNQFPNFIYRGKIPVKNKGEIDMYFIERG